MLVNLLTIKTCFMKKIQKYDICISKYPTTLNCKEFSCILNVAEYLYFIQTCVALF